MRKGCAACSGGKCPGAGARASIASQSRTDSDRFSRRHESPSCRAPHWRCESPFGLAGRYYPLCATALGAVFLAFALRGLRGGSRFDTNRWAKRVFAFSIVYLSVLLVVLLVARA